MNIVKFPGLDLEIKFSKIAFLLFGVSIYKYAVCIVIGIIVAMFLCRIAKEKYDVEFEFVVENFIIGIFFGIIGARLYFVLFNLDYYSKNFLEIFNLRNGGLAIYGGLTLGAIAIFVNCKIRKKDILNLLDYIVPYVAIAQCFGRFGNFFNIEAYGYQTKSLFRMGIETIDGYIEVHPTFLYEAISTFFIFVILKFFQRKRKFKGEIFLLYLLFYSGIRFFIEGIRTDSLMLFNYRISQILSFAIFFSSLAILICRNLSIEKTLKFR